MRHAIIKAICFTSLLISGYSHAVSVIDEKRELATISDHLTKLDFLIQRAEQRADYRSVRQFDYSALRSDLRDIQSGIAAYLYPSRPAPLPQTPLSGDYTVRTPQ
ncbi:integrative conjugative element protein, RAQPRD family [Photobacterium leiognathi]|uniref:integrative conjugative element protein, RAQPRD family n=1 Tax=Photobacterium leiognathi TaxID=553611 RepID=UPI0029816A3F|nr:RAQPRD family integrative conjugative element protein [Photobacterium leiognathi]